MKQCECPVVLLLVSTIKNNPVTHGSVLEVSPKLLGGIKRKATESDNNKSASVLEKISSLRHLCGRFFFHPKGNTFA